MFKKLAAVINEIETLLGVIESAFFHTRDCWILEEGEREREQALFSPRFKARRRNDDIPAAWSGLAQQLAVSTVF